jgi:Xaa-Pro aminopeptidase
MIKSEFEIVCMRRAADITRMTFDTVLDTIHAGMTEAQIVGIALGRMHELGAERESYPFWVLAGEGGNQAISRARHKELKAGDLVQLQFGARVAGYASSIGRQVVLGKANAEQRELISAGYQGQAAVLAALKSGVPARFIAQCYEQTMKNIGYRNHLLYGPCHGNGLMEGEAPWIESDSNWMLEENMTFCTDIFLCDDRKKFGLRIEDVVCILAEGVDNLTHYPTEIFERP